MQPTTWNTEPMSHQNPAPACGDAAAAPPADPLPPAADPLPGHGHEPEFPPALRRAGRILAAVAGILVGTAMLAIGGLYALLTTCVDYDAETALCGPLVGPLELVAVLGGTAAAVAGGTATAATGQARWIAGGLAITIVLVLLLAVLVGMQQSVMT